MANLWYTIPKKIQIGRDGETVDGVAIEEGWGGLSHKTLLGMDGGLTLQEAEELAWRLKQGIQLLKYGKIRHQHA